MEEALKKLSESLGELVENVKSLCGNYIRPV